MASIPNSHDSLFPMRDFLNQKQKEREEREASEGGGHTHDTHHQEASFGVEGWEAANGSLDEFSSPSSFESGSGFVGQNIGSDGGFGVDLGSFSEPNFEGHTNSLPPTSGLEHSFATSGSIGHSQISSFGHTDTASFGHSDAASFGQMDASSFGESDIFSASPSAAPSSSSSAFSPSPSSSFGAHSFDGGFASEGSVGQSVSSPHTATHSHSGTKADLSAHSSDEALSPLEAYHRKQSQKLNEKEASEESLRKKRVADGLQDTKEMLENRDKRRERNREKHNLASQGCQNRQYEGGSPWKNIGLLVDLNAVPDGKRKDVSRMREVLRSLASE